MKAPPKRGEVIVECLDQFHVALHANFVEQFAWRGSQQLGEPGVKSLDLHGAQFAQHAGVQLGKDRRQPRGVWWRDPARDQFLPAPLHRDLGVCEFEQPFSQALLHFARRLAREGDGQHFLGPRTLEQCAHDARDQDPGLARAGTGFNDDAALRVAGKPVEVFAADLPAIGAVGGLVHWDPIAALAQWSRRHRPRASQNSQVLPSPNG